MDPFTAALTLLTVVFQVRQAYWESLTPETRQLLAEKMAVGELRWLTLLESLTPKPAVVPAAQQPKKTKRRRQTHVQRPH